MCCRFTHTTTEGVNAWWKLNFPYQVYIASIILYNRMNCCEERLNGATLYIDEELVGTVAVGTVAGIQQKYQFSDIGKVGSEVKIGGGAGVISLTEVEVIGHRSCYSLPESMISETVFPVVPGKPHKISS